LGGVCRWLLCDLDFVAGRKRPAEGRIPMAARVIKARRWRTAQGRQPAVQVSAEAWTWLQAWWKAARSGPRRPRMPSAGTRSPVDRRRGGRSRRHRLVRRRNRVALTRRPGRDRLSRQICRIGVGDRGVGQVSNLPYGLLRQVENPPHGVIERSWGVVAKGHIEGPRPGRTGLRAAAH